MNELDKLRNKIDEIDSCLLELFEKRMAVSRSIGEYKRERSLPVLDENREKQVIQNRLDKVQDEKLKPAAREFFTSLMRLSKNAQYPPPKKQPSPSSAASGVGVAYQGIPGCYGEEAALAYFKNDMTGIPLNDFEAVFRSVSEGGARYGVLPLENSSTGSIARVYDLLMQYGCVITGEYYLPVNHCLLCVPGAAIEDIERIYSHEQGLLQCSAFLAAYPNWHQLPYHNTAVSARHVAELNDRSNAAIAGRRAAEAYGLDILAEGIQTYGGNYTRFIVVSNSAKNTGLENKISLFFSLKHQSGTLHSALSHFANTRLNLTKVESRPAPYKSWEYVFFVDFEGNLSGNDVKEALKALEKDCVELRVLGNYIAGNKINE
ncbi:MAG: prephenate dehydratase [Christensenellales bacterium]